jgi:hypothetical protein
MFPCRNIFFLPLVLFARPVNNLSACIFFAHSIDIFRRMTDRPKGIFRRPPLRTGGGQSKRNISTPYILFHIFYISLATCKKFEPENYTLQTPILFAHRKNGSASNYSCWSQRINGVISWPPAAVEEKKISRHRLLCDSRCHQLDVLRHMPCGSSTTSLNNTHTKDKRGPMRIAAQRFWHCRRPLSCPRCLRWQDGSWLAQSGPAVPGAASGAGEQLEGCNLTAAWPAIRDNPHRLLLRAAAACCRSTTLKLDIFL